MLKGSICIFRKHRPLFEICVNIELVNQEKAYDGDVENFFYRYHEAEPGLEAGMRSIDGLSMEDQIRAPQDMSAPQVHESIATLLSERSRLNGEATVNELKKMVESLRGEVALARKESSEVKQMMRSASIVFGRSWGGVL